MNDLERSLAFRPSESDIACVQGLPAKELPSFAVVVPSFNQAKYLPATLESILGQNYPNMEIFVADGGSSDGSVDIIADYASRHPNLIRYVSAPDGGHHHGVNKGIAKTSGDIIAWINSDDLYVEGAFWKVAAFFHFNRSAMIAYGRNNYVANDLSLVTEYPVDWSPLRREQVRRMMHFCLPPQPSLFFKRVAVMLCGALDHKILDYELWMRWQRDLPFYFIDDLLSLSRLQKDAISVNADDKLLIGICDVVHRYYGIVPYSWALRYAYNQFYGAAWARGGEAPLITRRIKLNGWRLWLALNIARLPRLAGNVARNFRSWLREGLRPAA
jgi:glycosyltransferase involved in cell wall biosynthesis